MLARLRQAWELYKQHVQVITAALFFLACIRVWEANQWTQLAESDLLHNLPHSAHPANHTSDSPSLGERHPDSLQAWSCKHSGIWFHGQEHRWPELEELADAYCQLELSPEPEAADAASPQSSTLHDTNIQTKLRMPDLIGRLQARLTTAAVDLSEAQQIEGLLSDHEPAADSTAETAGVENTTAPRAARPGLIQSVIQKFQGDILFNSSLASFPQYRDAHPKKAVIGLTGIMSYPRLTAFVLWLTGHQFRMANVKQAILDNAETASWWACMGLQALRCPFCGMVLMVFMPGMQTALYTAAFMTQQPHLALWVGVIALLKVASESYALQMLFTSPIPASDKLSSVICSHVLLPAVNLTMGLLYVCVQPFLPASWGYALYLLYITVMPLFTVWANVAVWGPNPAPVVHPAADHAAAERGDRRAEPDMVAVARAAIERNRMLLLDLHEGPNPRAAAAGAAADPNTAHHRHRDSHRGKEVHWPPPLHVPDHLEDSPQLPDSFKCPITFGIMKEPATTRNGLTYDRPAIMKWIEQHRRDPTTSLKLKAHHLSPNLSLRSVIQNWVDMHASQS
ncbi:hypothetical protein ABBQ38_012919 [Trebouxia sp. C0009 RCD-2024]